MKFLMLMYLFASALQMSAQDYYSSNHRKYVPTGYAIGGGINFDFRNSIRASEICYSFWVKFDDPKTAFVLNSNNSSFRIDPSSFQLIRGKYKEKEYLLSGYSEFDFTKWNCVTVYLTETTSKNKVYINDKLVAEPFYDDNLEINQLVLAFPGVQVADFFCEINNTTRSPLDFYQRKISDNNLPPNCIKLNVADLVVDGKLANQTFGIVKHDFEVCPAIYTESFTSSHSCGSIKLVFKVDLNKSHHKQVRSYKIKRKTGSGEYRYIATVPLDRYEYTEYVDKVKTTDDYEYQVWAVTEYGSEILLVNRSDEGETTSVKDHATEYTSLSDIEYKYIFSQELAKPVLKISWTEHGNVSSYEITKNSGRLDADIQKTENGRRFIIDANAEPNRHNTYQISFSPNCASNSYPVSVGAMGSPPDTDLNVSIDSSENGKVKLLWEKPGEDSVYTTERGIYLSNSEIFIDKEDLKSITGNTFALAGWFKLETDDSKDYNYFHFPQKFGIKLQSTDNELKLMQYDCSGNEITDILSENIKAKEWFHLAVSYDGYTIKVYKNGLLELEKSTVLRMHQTAGAYAHVNPLNNSLSVDEIKVWDVPLSVESVVKLAGFENVSKTPLIHYNMESMDAGTDQLYNSVDPNTYKGQLVNGYKLQSDTVLVTSADLLGFKILRGQELIGAVPYKAGEAHYSYSDSDAEPCVSNIYVISPVYIEGESDTSKIRATIRPYYSVQNVKASDALYPNKIEISWEDVDGELGYKIFRNKEQIAEIAKNTSEYNDLDILPGEYYSYDVQAYSECSESDVVKDGATDNGFIMPLGKVSGTVAGQKGSPVVDAKVTVPVKFGSSLKMENGDQITIPETTVSAIFPDKQEYAVSFWRKVQDKSYTVTAVDIRFKNASDKIHSGIVSSDTRKALIKPDWSFNDDITQVQWQHYVLYFGQDSVEMYINGVLKDSWKHSNIKKSSEISQILIYNEYGSATYIDELAIWSKLPWDGAITKYYQFLLTGEEDGLLSYYRFDENVEDAYTNADGTYISNHLFNLAQESNLKNGHNPVAIFSNGCKFSENIPSQLTYGCYTDIDGVFEIPNVNYGSPKGASFVVSASKKTEYLEHDITPEKKQCLLSAESKSKDGIEFTDNSLYPVSGKVYYKELLPKSAHKSSSFIAGASIMIDGEEPLSPVYTDEKGLWKAEVEPGFHTFSVKPKERKKSVRDTTSTGTADLNDIVVNVEHYECAQGSNEDLIMPNVDTAYRFKVSDGKLWNDFDFENTASYSLKVTVEGRCNFQVASTFDMLLKSADKSIEYEITADMVKKETNSTQYGSYTIQNLPPLKYTLKVIPSTEGIDLDAVDVDLTQGDTDVTLTYRSPMVVELKHDRFDDFEKSNATEWDGLPVYKYNNNTDSVFVAHKGDAIAVKAKVYELYSGKQCPLDSVEMTVTSNLGEGSEILYNGTFIPSSKMVLATTAVAGDPNLTGDHTKTLSVFVEDSVGRQKSIEESIIILGQKMTEYTFATKIKTVPLLWLPDPPGDNSYSSVEKGQEFCSSVEQEIVIGTETELATENNATPRVATTLGLGMVPGPMIEIEFNIGAKVELGAKLGIETTMKKSFEVCASLNEAIQTSDDNEIVGADADVFVGMGINALFGYALEVKWDTTENKVIVPKDSKLSIKADSLQTLYVYTRRIIRENLIENENILLAGLRLNYDSLTVDSLKGLYKGDQIDPDMLDLQIRTHEKSIEEWEKILEMSNYKDDYMGLVNAEEDNLNNNLDAWNSYSINTVADFVSDRVENLPSADVSGNRIDIIRSNISFGYGSNYSTSFEMTREEASEKSIEAGLEATMAVTATAKVNDFGTETKIGETLKGKLSIGKSKKQIQSFTAQVVLSDDDPGDYFTVDIMQDKKRGNFYFKTRAGVSKCPWEENTMHRESIKIDGSQNNTKTVTNIPYDDPALVKVKIGNDSETNEEGEYGIALLPESNPNGLKISVNGCAMNGNLVWLNVPPINEGGDIEIQLRADRTQKDVCDNTLQFQVVSRCMWDTEEVPISEGTGALGEFTLDLHWQKACMKGLTLDTDDNNWMINSSIANRSLSTAVSTQPIANDISKLDILEFKYSSLDAEDWAPVSELKKISKDLNGIKQIEYSWDAASIPDGEYKVALFATCIDDSSTNRSNFLQGRIARKIPKLLGQTEPADGICDKGDEISASFTQQLYCDDLNPKDQWNVVGEFPGSRYQVFARSVKFDGLNDKLVLTDMLSKTELDLSNDGFTVTMNVKPDANRAEKQCIIDGGWQLYLLPDYRLEFSLDETHSVISKTAVVAGEWNFIWAQVFHASDSTYLKVNVGDQEGHSLNGFEQASLGSVNTKLVAGTTAEGALPYKGLIDEIRIWNSDGHTEALSKCEMLVNGGNIAEFWRLDNVKPFVDSSIVYPNLQNGAVQSSDVPKWQLMLEDYQDNINATVDFSCFENKVQIVLPDDMHTVKMLENIPLTVSLEGVTDIFSNEAEATDWTFLVNRNSMKWELPNLDIVATNGTSETYTMDLWNLGGTDEEFKLTSLPDWLTASPATGTIYSGGKKQITFTVDNSVNPGSYSYEIYAENDEGWEPLRIGLTVLCEQPEWTVSPEAYEFNMNMVATVQLGSVNDELLDRYQLAAYIGSEVRGVGSIEKKEDGYQSFISIAGNKGDNNKSIQMHLWDADQCIERIGTELNTVFSYDNADLSRTFSFTDKVFLDIPLNKGWNWVSFNVSDAESGSSSNIGVLSKALSGNFSDGVFIKDQSKFTYYSNSGWIDAPLNSLSNTKGYKIKTDEAQNVKVLGYPANRESITLALNNGWNLVGYIPNYKLPLENAFIIKSGKFQKGDIIKSQEAFAVMNSEMQWEGTLEYLEPSKAYQIYMQSTDLSFAYAEKRKIASLKSGSEEISTADFVNWQADQYEFASSMSVIANIENGTQYMQLGVFKDGECRGKASASYFEGKLVYYLTVYGSMSDDLEFKVYDASKNAVFNSGSVLVYETDGIVGSIAEPFVVNLGTETDNPPVIADIPAQEIATDKPFSLISLGSYLTEMDGDMINWKTLNQHKFNVDIDQMGFASVTPKQQSWVGSETITFVAEDVTQNKLSDTASVIFKLKSATVIADNREATNQLEQNNPNPVETSTVIEFSLKDACDAELQIVNLTGTTVATVSFADLAEGKHIYKWDANSVAKGVYYYSLTTSTGFKATKMLIVK